jgi:homoserine kinase type II
MGERARIDDFALTLYYTNSTFSDDPTSDDRIGKLRTLVDAYDRGLDEPLSGAERAALPLALARTPLAFIAMIASVDSEAGARRLAAEMAADISWALDIARDLDRWQSAFARE